MKSALAFLEDFGDARAPGGGLREAALREAALREQAALAAARDEGHTAGYAEGFAAAAAEAEAGDRRLLLALRESLQDIDLTLAAARAEAIAALGPALAAAVRAAAPQAARAGLAEAVAAAVRERLEAAPGQPLRIRAAPAQAEALNERLGDLAEIRPDPALSEDEAAVEWEGGGARYDAGACARDAVAAVTAFFARPGATEEEMRDAG